MLLPSQSIPTAAAFLSTLSLFILFLLLFDSCITLIKVGMQQKNKENRGGWRPRSGRKKWLTASQRRRQTAIVRLTDNEKSALRRAARQAKSELSEWMRRDLLVTGPS